MRIIGERPAGLLWDRIEQYDTLLVNNADRDVRALSTRKLQVPHYAGSGKASGRILPWHVEVRITQRGIGSPSSANPSSAFCAECLTFCHIGSEASASGVCSQIDPCSTRAREGVAYRSNASNHILDIFS